jgi:hypothetical protein
MEYITVYDLSYQTMHFFWAVPLVVLFFALAYLRYSILVTDWASIKKGEGGIEIVYALAFVSLAVYMTVSITPPSIRNYLETSRIYYNQEYKVVEGEIEGFIPRLPDRRNNESFIVKGIKFEYSDSDLSYYGFNNTSSQGGPITGNGQLVRLAYITVEERNVILKIEMKP